MFRHFYSNLKVQGSDLSIIYASLGFRTPSRLVLASLRGISCISVALWSLERKCSETAVGLEMLVCLSTVLRCSLKRSLSFRLVSPFLFFITYI